MTDSTAISKRSQLPNFRPNPTNDLHPTTSHSTRTTRLLVSLAAVLLVAASAGFGMLFAWTTASKHSDLLGVLSVAMALGLELSKPFAISSAFTSLRQWRVITAAALILVGLLAVAYSLQSELSFMSTVRGDLVAERAGERDAAQRAADRYQALTAELAALRPASNKERDNDVYLARRAALLADLRQAELDRQQAPAVAAPDPGAVALSTYAASLGLKLDPALIGLWLPLVGVLALEIGAAFSVVLVRSVAASGGPQVAQAQPAGDPVAQESAAQVRKSESGPGHARRPQRKRKDDDDDVGRPKRGLPGLLNAVRANGGVIDMSQRKLARKLGGSRTTLQRAMRELSEAGMLVLDTSRAGTRLALAG